MNINWSNCAIERTADAGHKACGASFAPKAHRFPHSAVGDDRRTVHRGRYTDFIKAISNEYLQCSY